MLSMQLLWKLSSEDYYHEQKSSATGVDSFFLEVDFVDNGILQTCSK